MSYRMLINGELVASKRVFDVINPATGNSFAQAPSASRDMVDSAIVAAREGFVKWSGMPSSERSSMLLRASEILESNRSKLEELLSTEQGKPLTGAQSETSTAISMFKEAAKVRNLPVRTVKESTDHTLQVRHQPVGVVVGITPWNYPLSLGCGKICKALAYGNSVILKPSPFTPLTSLFVGELLQSVFPKGVVNVIVGDDTIPGEVSVGQLLTEDPRINLVSFTGSVATGKRVMAACAANMTRVMLELGGNDPAIVLADADIPAAAKGIFTIAMSNSGQICCAVKRVYVHESIFDSFVAELVKLAEEVKVGPGLEPGTTMGPLNNKAQFERVKMLLADAVERGGKVEVGGNCPSSGGYFIEPTVVTNVTDETRLVHEEQFGPVLPVLSFSSEADVIARANNSVYGLGASVWGRNSDALNRIADQLEAGIVWTNQHAVLREGAPFGGFKQSGFRREGDFGPSDLDTYTEVQAVKWAK